MNRIKRALAPATLVAALSTVLLASAPAVHAQKAATAAAPAAITLNMMPLPNSSQRHDVTMVMTMDMTVTPKADATEEQRAQIRQGLAAAGMPMTMTTEMRQRMDVGAKGKDGGVPIKATVDTVKAEMRNSAGMELPLPNQGQQITFDATMRDDRFENIRMSGMEQLKALPPEFHEKMFRQMFDWMAKFNGRELKPGESVEAPLDLELPMAGAGASNAKFLAKYTLLEVKRGVALFDIDVGMDMAMSLPLPAASAASAASGASAPASSDAAASATAPAASDAVPQAAPSDAAASAPAPAKPGLQPSQADIKGTGKGKMDFRLADRVPLRSTMDMTMKMVMLMPDGNTMHMDMSMKMDGKGSSVKKTTAKKPVPAKAK